MNGALRVARLEIVRRWQVLAAGLAGGVIPVAAAALLDLPEPAGVRLVMASVIALLFVVAIGGAIGASMIVSEITNGRAGFYFARPLSGAAIWAGKLLGSLVVVLGAAMLVLLPSLLLAIGANQGASLTDLALLALAVGVVLVLAHAGAVAWRSRSRLLVLDAAGAVVACAAAGWLLLRLLESAGDDAFMIGSGLAAGLTVLGAGAAGALQVVRGRGDLKRGHRVLTATMAAAAAVTVVALALFSHWYTAVDLADLDHEWIVASSPEGPWVAVMNRNRVRPGFYPTFLLDCETGRATRLRGCTSFPVASFSRDGKVFAWLQRPGVALPDWLPAALRERLAGGDVRVASLAGGSSSAEVVPATVRDARRDALVLSGDGRRLALVEAQAVSVLELPSGDLAASVALPADTRGRWVYFADHERLRFMSVTPNGGADALRILELDIASRRVTARHTLELAAGQLFAPLVDRAGDRMVLMLQSGHERRFMLVQATTGERVAVLEPPTGWELGSLPRLVWGGRVAFGVKRGSDLAVAVYGPDGDVQQVVRVPTVPSSTWLLLGGEVAPDRLLVSLRDRESTTIAFVVDLAGGGAQRVGEDLRPAWWPFGRVDPTTSPAPGSPVSRLLIGRDRRLELLDPVSLELHEVVPD